MFPASASNVLARWRRAPRKGCRRGSRTAGAGRLRGRRRRRWHRRRSRCASAGSHDRPPSRQRGAAARRGRCPPPTPTPTATACPTAPTTASRCATPTSGDTDADGIGNACDADLDNNGGVDFADLGRLRQAFLSSAGQPRYNPPCRLQRRRPGQLHRPGRCCAPASSGHPAPRARTRGPTPRAGASRCNSPEAASRSARPARAMCLQLTWQLTPAGTDNQLQFSVLGPDGEVQTRQASSAAGGFTVPLDAARGGPATVVARASYRPRPHRAP